MDLKILDSQKDDELRALMARADEILKKRKLDGDVEAIKMSISLIEERGLPTKELKAQLAKLTGAPKVKAATTFKPKADHVYQHPDNPALKANGTGVKPKWWNDLIAAGKQPVDLGQANKQAA